MLRDSFANYVVQTAMDFADEHTKPLLIEQIRPIVPTIRNTPHGRRIASKIGEYDNGKSGIQGMSPPPVPMDNVTSAPFSSQETFTRQDDRNNMMHSGMGRPSGFVGGQSPWAKPFSPFGQPFASANSQDYRGMNAQQARAYDTLNGTFQAESFSPSQYNQFTGRHASAFGHF